MTPTTRLVSFLGLGLEAKPPFYNNTTYELEGRHSSETPLMERAVFDLMKTDSMVVLGTKQVKDRWFNDDCLFAKYMGPEAPAAHFQLLEHGSSKMELWKIFEELTKALSCSPIIAAGEATPPSEIILDVTHGFRIQPLFGMAALNFSLSEMARQNMNPRPEIRVLYGAWEAKNRDDITPIWDLTEFVTASRWNAAIDALMRYGRADDFEQMALSDSKRNIAAAKKDGLADKELGKAGYSKQIGVAARIFADDLATVRLRDIHTNSSRKLYEVLGNQGAKDLANRLPPLGPALKKLRDWVAPLRSETTLGKDGLEASGHLAGLLGRLERYAAQVVVIREGLITHHHHTPGDDKVPLPEPGPEFLEKLREEEEKQWGKLGRKFLEGSTDFLPYTRKNLSLSQSVFNARNDMMHGGLNTKPSSSSRLRKKLKEITDEYIDLCTDGDETIAETNPSTPIFLNLSNHPIATWPTRQLKMAAELGFGEPSELEEKMPVVSPEADEVEIEDIAVEVAGQAAKQGAVGAFVASDFTFAFALVRALNRRGIRCFCTTTARSSREEKQTDETINVQSVFRFVRWREYV